MLEFEKRESFKVDDSLLGLKLVPDMDGENYNIVANFAIVNGTHNGKDFSVPSEFFVDPETGECYFPDEGIPIGYHLKPEYLEKARDLAKEKGIQLQIPTFGK